MSASLPAPRPFADRLLAVLLFLGAAALYVWSAGPGLTAYRDTGEMVVLLKTLGVGHPPGYPLYTLVGSLVLRVLPGCAALAANYFSALAGAAAVAALFLFLRRFTGLLPALVGAASLAFYRPFWELAAVSEMYTFGILWVILTLDATFHRRNPAFAGLLFGLGLGVRMDTLILAPLFVAPFVRDRRRLLAWIGFAAAGAGVFLYLAVRSASDPWLDWGNPETLEGLFASVSRRSYGSGLDLLSQYYATGANFAAGAALFARSLWRYLGPAGAVLGIVGLVYGRPVRGPWGAVLAGFLLSGPVFLFMANMPPNPHAVAILDAAFVLPALFFCIATAMGLERLRGVRFGGAAAAIALALCLVTPRTFAAEAVKRNAWALRDYTEGLLRSAPRSAVVVLREDVQLFGLWQAQLIENRRPDLSVIGVGLSSSDWYWQMVSRWPTAAVPTHDLKTAEGFGRLAREPRPVLAGYETDVPEGAGLVPSSCGLLRRLSPAPVPTDPRLLAAVSLFRESTVSFPDDFFTRDLRADVANAFRSQGVDMLRVSTGTAEALFRKAEALDPDNLQPLMDRGYLRLVAGDAAAGAELYARAAGGLEALLQRAAYYRSLPAVISGVKQTLATARLQEGVCLERLGRVDDARARYELSIAAMPTAIAHYNLAVTYWNKDWSKAISHFEQAAAIDPSATQAARYLEMARKAGLR